MITFYPNCTLPPTTPAFVLGPNTRSTLSIVWNCLGTLILCTWSILHLNVPPQLTPRSTAQIIRRWLYHSGTKLKWMVITILAPETIMGIAYSALKSAWDSDKVLSELANGDGVEWSTAHSFFADMGGFVVMFEEWAGQDMALMDGSNLWALTAAQVALARNRNIISCLPSLSKDELRDKNKGDLLVKSLALFQILWMILQLFVRWKNNKQASQLEIMTLSFAVCPCIIYMLTWSRPQDIHTPIIVRANRRATSDDITALARIGPEYFWFERKHYTMPNNVVHSLWPMSLSGGAGAILFGLLHYLASKFTFPTLVEDSLWTASCFVTFLAPVVCFLATFANNPNKWLASLKLDRSDDGTFNWQLIVSFAVPFVFARLFLLVELFRTLYFLPPEVYTSTWGANVP
ncbi:hypothetical protein CC80DRAFT_416530 [Byssothecium circinans]|uniref:Uncharacterized protein n=1 Tax=Byssothecium circinans TaxID=147558 RepID=A0A6A5TTP4_9PLEO|nr:hypothetical protein CC80DRAFT_416530 [Byssothecium circinans]